MIADRSYGLDDEIDEVTAKGYEMQKTKCPYDGCNGIVVPVPGERKNLAFCQVCQSRCHLGFDGRYVTEDQHRQNNQIFDAMCET